RGGRLTRPYRGLPLRPVGGPTGPGRTAGCLGAAPVAQSGPCAERVAGGPARAPRALRRRGGTPRRPGRGGASRRHRGDERGPGGRRGRRVPAVGRRQRATTARG